MVVALEQKPESVEAFLYLPSAFTFDDLPGGFWYTCGPIEKNEFS